MLFYTIFFLSHTDKKKESVYSILGRREYHPKTQVNNHGSHIMSPQGGHAKRIVLLLLGFWQRKVAPAIHILLSCLVKSQFLPKRTLCSMSTHKIFSLNPLKFRNMILFQGSKSQKPMNTLLLIKRLVRIINLLSPLYPTHLSSSNHVSPPPSSNVTNHNAKPHSQPNLTNIISTIIGGGPNSPPHSSPRILRIEWVYPCLLVRPMLPLRPKIDP